MKKILLYIFFLFAFTSCHFDPTNLPSVYVNFTIYPNDITYADLLYPGGYMYFTGGVNGIVIYRVDYNNFVAYDRACPYDWEDNDSWLWVADDGLTLIDSACGSRYNILNGDPIDGPATLPLRYYKTIYDGMRLRVKSFN